MTCFLKDNSEKNCWDFHLHSKDIYIYTHIYIYKLHTRTQRLRITICKYCTETLAKPKERIVLYNIFTILLQYIAQFIQDKDAGHEINFFPPSTPLIRDFFTKGSELKLCWMLPFEIKLQTHIKHLSSTYTPLENQLSATQWRSNSF